MLQQGTMEGQPSPENAPPMDNVDRHGHHGVMRLFKSSIILTESMVLPGMEKDLVVGLVKIHPTLSP
jgi:hypothetical protein